MNGLRLLQEFLKNESYDCAILKSMVNLRYFAGFTGTTATAFITQEQAYIITDSRYTEQARLECKGYEVIQYTLPIWETIRDLADRLQISTGQCVFEGDLMALDTYMEMAEALPQIEFLSLAFNSLRIIKRDDELEKMRRAFAIADESFQAILPLIKPGMTEQEAKILLEIEMLKRGSSEPSFTTIVASGVRSSLPHGVASHKVMEEGDFVTFDFGAVYEGYHSDMTRTIVLGKASEEQKKLYDIVLTAQTKGVAAAKAGLSGKDLDAICRNYITEAGYGSYFGHGTGHGVGLDIHELPIASPRSTDILEPGMVVTIEPGIYLPGKQGLRIEDTVVITEEGCEILTKTSKELIELTV